MSREITQDSRVLQYMIDNGSITTWEAIKEFGITRLSDKIFRLRNKGYIIENEWENSINRYGDKVRYARYTLNMEKSFNFATKEQIAIKYPFETISCKI